jgi:hypothetical protein
MPTFRRNILPPSSEKKLCCTYRYFLNSVQYDFDSQPYCGCRCIKMYVDESSWTLCIYCVVFLGVAPGCVKEELMERRCGGGGGDTPTKWRPKRFQFLTTFQGKHYKRFLGPAATLEIGATSVYCDVNGDGCAGSFLSFSRISWKHFEFHYVLKEMLTTYSLSYLLFIQRNLFKTIYSVLQIQWNETNVNFPLYRKWTYIRTANWKY